MELSSLRIKCHHEQEKPKLHKIGQARRDEKIISDNVTLQVVSGWKEPF